MIGCKNDGDVLATYDGGQITRGELVSRLEAKDLPVGKFLENKKLQIKELRMIGVDRIAVLEAKKQGYDKSDRFNFLFNDVRNKHLGSFLLKKVIKESGFSEKAVMVSHIVLKVRSNAQIDVNHVLAKANEIIQKLEEGESFEKVARTYSEDITKKTGGQFGTILYEMFPKEYSDVAFSLEKGKFNVKPIYLKKRKRIFIIKVDEIFILTDKNLQTHISDERMQKSYKKIIYRKIRKKYLDDLKKNNEESFHEDKLYSTNDDDIVFSVGAQKFTVKTLNEKITLLQNIMSQDKKNLSRKQRKNIIERFYVSELVKGAALKAGIGDSEEFKTVIDGKYLAFLAGDYMEYVSQGKISIPESKIRESYDRLKEKMFFRFEWRGKNKIKVTEPYNKVRDKIEDFLRKQEGMKINFIWLKENLKTYNFNIDESVLDGK